MSLTEKIFALEAKIADLEQQLTSQISEQKEHDIRQQLIENTKLLNTYNQSAPAGNLGVLEETMKELAKEVHAISLRQHVMNEKLPKIIDVRITPSEYKKSTHKQEFLDVLDVLGLGRTIMSQRVTKFEGSLERSNELDFSFNWRKGQSESESYEPLMKHLTDKGLSVVCVDGGQNLPDGLLYQEEIWSLKQNTSLRSEELRKTSSEPLFKYTICGRTDLVRVRYQGDFLGKFNNQYLIEIKKVEDFVIEDSLREAVLQLIGCNVANTFHSPPVVLTNLAKFHFVLFITLDGDPIVALKFKLNVLKMRTLGDAIAFVEEKTASFKTVTQHFGRKPTPPSSPCIMNEVATSEDFEAITENFSSVCVRETVIDYNNDEF